MCRILLIDDDRDIRELYTEVLEMLGHTVDSAPDGEVGLRIALARRPDLIVTDMNMPRMNGLELVRLLRHDEQFDKTPIIMHSGNAAPCMRGITAFLPKPAELTKFEALVTRVLATTPGRGMRCDGSRRAAA
jgi:CheY-like chemotaxis protein